MIQRIQMSSPDIDESDIAGVVEVLRSGQLALGPKCEEFERLIADYVGVNHAVAVSSGTAALHLLVRALGFQSGDEVLVPSFTFAASVNALLFEGVTPVFVDIEPDTFNLDPDDVERHITPRTRGIMAVDAFGHPAEWDRIDDIARRHDLRVIDDSCEALGAAYRGRRIGQFGDAAAFGFYPNKQLTTGEGGVLVTNDTQIATVCRSLRNQGRAEMGAWLEHERLGYNYRLDEMSCALGCSQMRRLDLLLAKREAVAHRYTERLRGLDWVSPPTVRTHVRRSCFVYIVTVRGLERQTVIDALAAAGIPSRAYFAPVHQQRYMAAYLQSSVPKLPVTEEVARRTVALPFHGNMTDEAIDTVVDVLSRLHVPA